jgi:hypothetical protein
MSVDVYMYKGRRAGRGTETQRRDWPFLEGKGILSKK